MNRSFSIATLFLIMAVVAFSMASIRGVWVRVAEGAGDEIIIPVGAGIFAGAVYGAALGIWNSPWRLFTLRTWLRAHASSACGALLGAAVGAQITAPIGWTTVSFAPMVVIGLAALVVVDRRRRAQLTSPRSASSERPREAGRSPTPPDAESESVPGPVDRSVLAQD